MAQTLSRSSFGEMPDGGEVEQFTLRNSAGMSVTFMEYGATMISVKVPDRGGRVEEVTENRKSLEEYLAGHPLLGSTVGRFANRIDCRETGGLMIDGEVHPIVFHPKSGVHIHGGKTGFQKQMWTGSSDPSDSTRFQLRHRSPDGHEGFPGNFEVTLTVALSEDNAISLIYEATTDKTTHATLTNHVYWNLAGPEAADVLGHVVEVSADERLEFDERKVATGKFLPVEGTAFDFRSRAFEIGARKDVVWPYDHCYRIAGYGQGKVVPCAQITEPESGRVLTIVTTEPGVQFYTGNPRGFCFETQHFPNSPNLPEFPTTLIRPGEKWVSQTVYRFAW